MYNSIVVVMFYSEKHTFSKDLVRVAHNRCFRHSGVSVLRKKKNKKKNKKKQGRSHRNTLYKDKKDDYIVNSHPNQEGPPKCGDHLKNESPRTDYAWCLSMHTYVHGQKVCL